MDQPLIFQLGSRIYIVRVVKGRELLGADTAHSQAQSVKNLAHPAAVTARKIIVYRYQVGASTIERIQVERQSGYECLTFTRSHLHNFTSMQKDAAHYLYILVA